MRRPSSRSTRTLVGSVAMVAVVSLLSACGGSSSNSQSDGSAVTVGTTPSSELPAGPPVSGGSLAFGIAAETDSLNPYFGQWAASAYTVANAIYEPLAAFAVDGTVKPYLAESITTNADFTQWTIRTRPGIVFHDGEKLDAAAVASNIEYVTQSPVLGTVLETIKSVTAVDDDTVTIEMKAPWSTFPQVLTAQIGYMAAPSMRTAANPATADPIGTGPFVFESRVVDANVVVSKNPNYWQAGKPLLDAIKFEVLHDATSRAQAMAAGDIDGMQITTPDVLADAIQQSDNGKEQLLTNAGQETDEFVMALNTASPPFDDILARQTLAAAINQDELSKLVYQGVYPAAWGNFEPGSRFYITPEEAGYPSPDPVRAQQLADEYRQKHGQPLSFTFQVNAEATTARMAQAIEAELEPFGISVAIDQVDQATSISHILTGNYQAGFFLMTSAPTLDKGYLFIASKPASSGISVNYTRLDDPEITAALDAARATDDPSKRIEQYNIVQRRMATNLDRIFLYHDRTAAAFTNEVHGFTTATFPGSDERAFAPSIAAPFFASMWIER